MPKKPAQDHFSGLSTTQWLICIIAWIGFAFDTYELLVLTLTVQPALTEFLTAPPGSPEFNHWVGMLFYIPAIAGGVFGLLGGYLIDRLGRRRVLLWSILAFLRFRARHHVFDLRVAVPDLPLDNVRWCFRGIRGRNGVAGGIVYGARSKGKRFSGTRRHSLPPAAS